MKFNKKRNWNYKCQNNDNNGISFNTISKNKRKQKKKMQQKYLKEKNKIGIINQSNNLHMTHDFLISNRNLHHHLTNEISNIVDSLKLTQNQLSQRLITFNKLKTYMEGLKLRAELYGSFSTDLSLSTSDIDISVFNYVESESGERKIINVDNISKIQSLIVSKLTREQAIKQNSLQVLRYSKVPLIKFNDRDYGIQVDITINQENGLTSLKLVNNILSSYPIIKTSVLFFKLLLRQFKLNDASQGGLSSFMIFHMVLAYYRIYILLGLDHMSNLKYDFNAYEKNFNTTIENQKFSSSSKIDFATFENNANKTPNLGKFIICMLKFYAEDFDSFSLGLYTNNLVFEINNNFTKVKSSELIYDKHTFFPNSQSDNLSIQNIIMIDQDVGVSGRDFLQVKRLFKLLLNNLKNQDSSKYKLITSNKRNNNEEKLTEKNSFSFTLLSKFIKKDQNFNSPLSNIVSNKTFINEKNNFNSGEFMSIENENINKSNQSSNKRDLNGNVYINGSGNYNGNDNLINMISFSENNHISKLSNGGMNTNGYSFKSN